MQQTHHIVYLIEALCYVFVFVCLTLKVFLNDCMTLQHVFFQYKSIHVYITQYSVSVMSV